VLSFCSADEVVDQSKNMTLELFLAAVAAENVKSQALLQFLFWYSLSRSGRHAVLPVPLRCDPTVAAMGAWETRSPRGRDWLRGWGAISRSASLSGRVS